MATFVVTADHEEMVDNLLDALHLWLMRINYLKQPQNYPSIETAQQRRYSQRELEKITKDKKRIISGLPDDVAQHLSTLQKDYDVDEIMILPHVFGEENRLNLIKLVANAIH